MKGYTNSILESLDMSEEFVSNGKIYGDDSPEAKAYHKEIKKFSNMNESRDFDEFIDKANDRVLSLEALKDEDDIIDNREKDKIIESNTYTRGEKFIPAQRDIQKMEEYRNKGSKPAVLANTVKDKDKAISRYFIALQMDWEECAIEFARRTLELGYTQDDLDELNRQLKKSGDLDTKEITSLEKKVDKVVKTDVKIKKSIPAKEEDFGKPFESYDIDEAVKDWSLQDMLDRHKYTMDSKYIAFTHKGKFQKFPYKKAFFDGKVKACFSMTGTIYNFDVLPKSMWRELIVAGCEEGSNSIEETENRWETLPKEKFTDKQKRLFFAKGAMKDEIPNDGSVQVNYSKLK